MLTKSEPVSQIDRQVPVQVVHHLGPPKIVTQIYTDLRLQRIWVIQKWSFLRMDTYGVVPSQYEKPEKLYHGDEAAKSLGAGETFETTLRLARSILHPMNRPSW